MNIEMSRWVKFGSTANSDFYEVEQHVLAVVPHEGCIDNAETASASVRNVYRNMPDPAFRSCFALVGGSMFGYAADSILLGQNPPKAPTRLYSTF